MWQDVLVRAVVRRLVPVAVAMAIGGLVAVGLIPPAVEECVKVTLQPDAGDGV